MRKEILFLTPRFPYPPIGGDRVKSYHLLSILAKKHAVTCVSFIDGTFPQSARIHALESLGVQVRAIPLHPVKAALRTGATLLSAKPLEIQYYADARFRRAVAAAAQGRRFDLAVAFFMRTAEYALPLAGMPKILMAEDARLLLQQRATAAFRLSAGYAMQWFERRKLSRYEPRISSSFDAVTYVSAFERAFMEQMNPGIRAAIVSNGVDIHAFPFSGDQSNRAGIVFCGKMDVQHNIDMALRIGREIFPRLCTEFPGLEFAIVGKNPARAVRQLAGGGINVLGEVDRVQEYVRRAVVFVHPQALGTGIQNKVLESMALGTPVVTTPLGITGIAARDGVHARIASGVEGIIAATAQLLRSAQERGNLARNARRLIEQEYSWESVEKQLYDVIERVAGWGLERDRSAQMPREERLAV